MKVAIMYVAAEVICRRNDKRKAKKLAASSDLVLID